MQASSPFGSTVWLLLEKTVSVAISFGVTLAIARHFLPEIFGNLSYLLALVALASPLMALGLNSLVSREVLSRPAQAELIVGTALALRFIMGILVAPLMMILANFYLDDGNRDLFYFLILASVANAALVIDFWLQAYVANRYASAVRLTSLIFFSFLRILAVIWDAGLSTFVYLASLEFVLVGLLYMLAYNRLSLGAKKLRYSLSETKRLLSDSRWLLLSGVAAMVYLRVDQVMLGVMVDDHAVGIYAASARVSEVWYFIPAAIATSFFPQLIRHRLDDPVKYGLSLQKLNDFLFCSALGVALLISLCASWLFPLLFGPSYADSIPVLKVHIWVGLFVFMRALLSKWLITENLLKLSMFTQLSGALANVILNLWLIPLYGAVGAAYATVISYAVAGYLVLFLHRDLWPMAIVVTKSLLLPYRLLGKGRRVYQN